MITVMLEAVMDKQRIVEIYLNVIEWGDGVVWRQKPPRSVLPPAAAGDPPRQAAQLAAMVPNPRYYDTLQRYRSLAAKAAIIQRRMAYADVPG